MASRFTTSTYWSLPCPPVHEQCSGWFDSVGRIASQKPGSCENQWLWPRDNQLGEDIHHYAQRHGVQVLALLRTLALNLLRCNGFPLIRAGLKVVAQNSSRMLSWVGISHAKTG